MFLFIMLHVRPKTRNVQYFLLYTCKVLFCYNARLGYAIYCMHQIVANKGATRSVQKVLQIDIQKIHKALEFAFI